MLECREVSVTFRQGSTVVEPLQRFSLTAGRESLAIMGPSGSGKTTLLRVIAGLHQPDEGQVFIDGEKLTYRRRSGDQRVSLIHQDYRLIEFLNVCENLKLAAELRKAKTGIEVGQALEMVGLTGFDKRMPTTLSGGEQQRVAIARTLMTDSRVILADEPTGALDERNTEIVADLLAGLSRCREICVVVATHDPMVAARMSRKLSLRESSEKQSAGV